MKFLVDAMFGNLARWLRFLGHDTVWANEFDSGGHAATDTLLLEVAGEQGRLLVTRDKQFAERARARGIPNCFVPFTRLLDCLGVLVECTKLELEFDPGKARCPRCNFPLRRVDDKDSVRDLVPPGSFAEHEEFWQCTNTSCEQVYWEGIHTAEIRATLEKLGRISD
ncbi:MAG: DUF5615 family PIN-like protein [Promethearchaeota archaeon]